MKKKVWTTLLILAVVAVGTAAVLPGLLGGGRTLPEGAAAMYKDTVISEETVAYLENAYAQAGRTVSREEIIDDLLTDCVVEEAAVLYVYLFQRQTYTDFPEARAVVDSYCEDTGITLEDYWAMAEEQARHTILQAKYQEWFYGEKLPELEISPQDQEGAAKAYAEHCAQLLSQKTAPMWCGPEPHPVFQKPVNKKGRCRFYRQRPFGVVTYAVLLPGVGRKPLSASGDIVHQDLGQLARVVLPWGLSCPSGLRREAPSPTAQATAFWAQADTAVLVGEGGEVTLGARPPL